MRDWTKAMAALLAAISAVALAQGVPAQDAQTAKPAQEVPAQNAQAAKPAPAVPAQDAQSAKPAVKADDDPFAANSPKAGTDLTQGDLKVSDLNSIDLHVADANLLDVLRSLADKTRKNIVTSKSVGGKITANLYGVTFSEALDAILHANGYAYREKGNFIYVYTAKELSDVVRSERKMTTQTFPLYYVPAAVAKDMIVPAMSSEAVVAVSKEAQIGVDPEATDVGGNSYASPDVLIVTDYEDNLEAIRTILKSIDERPQQVLVEATIMQATLSDTNSLGVDFTLLGGVDFSTVGSTNSGATQNGVVAAGLSDQGFNSVGTNVKGNNTQGLNVGVVYNNIAVFINALESITDTNVLANPKVLTVNKQPGAVIVGRKDGYVTTTTTSTTSQQTVEFLETGTRLIFRPFIGNDGYIRMEIHPEDSTGEVVVTGNFSLPKKTTTEVTTNVMVRDGHTIVIGGLFRERNTINKSQVPLLGDIPWAGQFFRSQTDIGERTEVIILLTPHIIKDQRAYSEASVEQMKTADLLRAGLRQGMMPWGRDRLAEMSYTKAREETTHKYYDRERAMWYLDCATNLNPMFTEALQLKEQVSGQQIMESDNSSIRHFLSDVVMNEKSVVPATEMTTAPADVLAVPAAPAPAIPVPAKKQAPAVTPAVPAKVEEAAPPAPAAPAETPAAPAAPSDPAVAPAVKELPAAGGAGSSDK